MQPLILHSHPGPNPWKVAIILEELHLPYDVKIWVTGDLKKPPFSTTLNPNGFTPVVEDPNTNVKVWESGAIIQYLLDTYDTNRHLTFPLSSAQEHASSLQYQWFQATFQGPNLSAVLRFTRFTPNKEARQRFTDESLRVLRVLEGDLQRNSTGWLVGAKCSAADLVFVPYMWSLATIMGDDTPNMTKYPGVDAWINRLNERTAVQKAKTLRGAALSALNK